jgi:hypothetical protein
VGLIDARRSVARQCRGPGCVPGTARILKSAKSLPFEQRLFKSQAKPGGGEVLYSSKVEHLYSAPMCVKMRIHPGRSATLSDCGLTDRNCGKSLYRVVKELKMYLRGWWNYFRPSSAGCCYATLYFLIIMHRVNPTFLSTYQVVPIREICPR